MSMEGSVRLRRNAVRLVSDHCPACVGLLSGINRKSCPPSPECASSLPQQPEPDALSPQATEDALPEKKKRRQLPPEFPRRDVVVHMPPGVCKTCSST
jgi:hypothetical protein